MSENRPPMEQRSAVAIGEVNQRKREVEVIAVPYDEEAVVPYRGEMWKESFQRGAFEGIQSRNGRVMVNREHTVGDTVGKVSEWWPERSEGLVGVVKVVKSNRGDETLALAEEGMVGASVQFGAWMRDVLHNRSAMTRRVLRAFVDHLSFVEQPAYVGATVLGVRATDGVRLAADLDPLNTPALDDLVEFLAALKGRHNIAS